MGEFEPIHRPGPAPMSIVFFASGGPGNFRAALDAAEERPDLMRVPLLVTDRPGTASAELARARGIPVIEGDYAAFAGPLTPARTAAGIAFHDEVLRKIEAFEAERGLRFDLAVLAYRRIIGGALLARFEGRAINQHPADLAWLEGGERAYVGIGGHDRSLAAGRGGARTSTILVRQGVDTGEILCRGPFVPFAGSAASRDALRAHETLQKARSDWPCLRFVLLGLAAGRFGLAASERHPDGCRVVSFDGVAQPYGGVELGTEAGAASGQSADTHASIIDQNSDVTVLTRA
jgi:folate-dependent phosphoribosylglycinamide formyltransferase PurN